MTHHRIRDLAAGLLAATVPLLAACSSPHNPPATPTAVALGGPVSPAAAAVTAQREQDPATAPATEEQLPAPPASDTGKLADACGVVTEQDLTTLLGGDPGPGTASADGSTRSCLYTGGPPPCPSASIPAVGEREFDMYCSTDHPQPNIDEVNGVGDGACQEIVGGPIAAMYILAGPDLVSINIQGGLDTKITPDKLTALGKSAVSRL